MNSLDLTPHQLAALNYKDHISLTANAGSGKTLVLSKRYVEIALNEDVSLRNIVAITFTEKASGELYNKINAEIISRLDLDLPEKILRRLERIRRELVSANISTIHSFCIEILRNFPIEAGLDANFTPVDQITADELVRLSVEEVIKDLLYDKRKTSEIKQLIRTFSSRGILAGVITGMIQKRKIISHLKELIYSKDHATAVHFFEDIFNSRFTAIVEPDIPSVMNAVEKINRGVEEENDIQPDSVVSDVYSLLARCREISEGKTPGDSYNLVRVLNSLKQKVITANGNLRRQGYLRKNRELFDEEIKVVEKFFANELLDYFIPGDTDEINKALISFGKALLSVYDKALSLYSRKKNQYGYLDFEDILIYTQNILLQPEVRQQLGEKYKYIMVDEYQDTNEIQYEIFMPILDYLNRGNLFVVGDEKQSIYMFRGAEPEIFDITKNNISEHSGQEGLLSLPDSFRMSPVICAFTNFMFSRLLKEPKAYFNETEYSGLVCAKDMDKDENDDDGQVELLLSPKDFYNKAGEENAADIDEATENDRNREAMLVARRIIRLAKDKKIGFGSIAVLCRKRRSFNELERVFTKYNIPFTIAGGKGFYQRQIVYDVYNYLSFMINPDNDAALTGILRSPFFFVSDAELFNITNSSGSSLWEKLQSFYSDDNLVSEEIVKAVDILKKMISIAGKVSLTQVLRKIFSNSSYIAVLSAKPSGKQELANLDKLMNLARTFSSFGLKTLYDFTNYLHEAIRNIDDEGQAVSSVDDNTVKIMTLHQAKGLEFDAVFLYSADDYTRPDTVKAKAVTVSKEFGLLTNLPLDENYFEDYRQAPVVVLYNYISRRKNLAEIKRLLYVGITRAKKFLFISAKHKNYRFNKESFMGLILEGLNINFQNNVCPETVKVKTSLEFLKKRKDVYCTTAKDIELDINITESIPNTEPVRSKQKKEVIPNYDINLQQLQDVEEEEFYSASRLITYIECPYKYKLTYELGLSKLYEQNSVFSALEKDSGLIKGKVIHRILQNELDLIQAGEVIDEYLKKETGALFNEEDGLLKLKSEIIKELEVFYSSPSYTELKAAEYYRNEYEVYVKNKNYYLFGVIDKVIFSGDKAVIVDYKTDSLPTGGNMDRYIWQLKFYTYLLYRLYDELQEIEIKLIFIKSPDMNTTMIFTREEVSKMEDEISCLIDKIRSASFDRKDSYCSGCSYSNYCSQQN